MELAAEQTRAALSMSTACLRSAGFGPSTAPAQPPQGAPIQMPSTSVTWFCLRGCRSELPLEELEGRRERKGRLLEDLAALSPGKPWWQETPRGVATGVGSWASLL